jgi:RNA polymerase sigma-70 factor (ECF subfamily)
LDRQTLDRLVVEHLPAALRFAQRLVGDADTAEDVVQETLCRVLRHGAGYRGEAAFQTWVLQIVLNVDRDRRRRLRTTEPLSSEQLTARTPSAYQQATADETSDQIRRAIQRLPDRQREAAVLSYGEGLAAPEIADILQTTVANVHTCLHLARKRIAAAIDMADLKPK